MNLGGDENTTLAAESGRTIPESARTNSPVIPSDPASRAFSE